MRTTLTIADDVLFAVKERARREKRSIGDVISDLAREALTGVPLHPREESEGSFLGFEPLPNTGKTVSNALVDQLREEEMI